MDNAMYPVIVFRIYDRHTKCSYRGSIPYPNLNEFDFGSWLCQITGVKFYDGLESGEGPVASSIQANLLSAVVYEWLRACGRVVQNTSVGGGVVHDALAFQRMKFDLGHFSFEGMVVCNAMSGMYNEAAYSGKPVRWSQLLLASRGSVDARDLPVNGSTRIANRVEARKVKRKLDILEAEGADGYYVCSLDEWMSEPDSGPESAKDIFQDVLRRSGQDPL